VISIGSSGRLLNLEKDLISSFITPLSTPASLANCKVIVDSVE